MNADPATPKTPFDDGELYDRLAGDLDYGREFYLDLAHKAAGPVLDVACGTGRILLPALAAGIDIEGLDLYPSMLDQLRSKAKAQGLSVTLHQSDMKQFQLSRQFALIMIPFNAIIHNMSADDQISTLATCREHLLPGGSVVYDTFFPSRQITNTPPGTRELEGETRDPATGMLVRIYDTRTFDLVQQTQHSLTEVEFLDEDNRVTRVVPWEFTTRWYYKNETELLLRLAGFSKWEIYGDFQRRPIEKDTDLLIVAATR